MSPVILCKSLNKRYQATSSLASEAEHVNREIRVVTIYFQAKTYRGSFLCLLWCLMAALPSDEASCTFLQNTQKQASCNFEKNHPFLCRSYRCVITKLDYMFKC